MILKYLGQYKEFEIVIFKEEVVKQEPIEVFNRFFNHCRIGRNATF